MLAVADALAVPLSCAAVAGTTADGGWAARGVRGDDMAARPNAGGARLPLPNTLTGAGGPLTVGAACRAQVAGSAGQHASLLCRAATCLQEALETLSSSHHIWDNTELVAALEQHDLM